MAPMWREALPSREAAKLLGISPRTLENWRQAGKGPPHLYAGSNDSPFARGIIYPLDWLMDFLEAREAARAALKPEALAARAATRARNASRARESSTSPAPDAT